MIIIQEYGHKFKNMDIENQTIVVPEKNIYVIENSYAIHVTKFKPQIDDNQEQQMVQSVEHINILTNIYNAIPVFMCFLTILSIVIIISLYILKS